MEISQVFEGAPAGADEKVSAVFALLGELGISYTRVEHDHADTMDDCVAIGERLGAPLCKNLFLTNRQQTDFYLLLMPGDKPFHTKDLSAQIESTRLSFASPEHMESLLGTKPGSASAMGLMFDAEKRVTLLIDRDVYQAEYLACHPCDNTGSLRIRMNDFLRVFLRHTGHAPRLVRL